jgi:hypothetical protein
LWSTSQLSLWSGVFTWRPELSFRCLLSKVISFIISMLYIEQCHLILPLFVVICEIWLLGLTYGVYLVLFLKPGVTISPHSFFDACSFHVPTRGLRRSDVSRVAGLHVRTVCPLNGASAAAAGGYGKWVPFNMCNIRSTFATFRWNTCNIRLKHLKHL